MRTQLTIVGGGLGGLVTAISAREAGLEVTLYEARKELGGRARTTPGPHRANWGPHVIYSDGPLWAWLDQRGLARPAEQDLDLGFEDRELDRLTDVLVGPLGVTR